MQGIESDVGVDVAPSFPNSYNLFEYIVRPSSMQHGLFKCEKREKEVAGVPVGQRVAESGYLKHESILDIALERQEWPGSLLGGYAGSDFSRCESSVS